jgi:hypothetical protein
LAEENPEPEFITTIYDPENDEYLEVECEEHRENDAEGPSEPLEEW